jgi:hypothetical protein
MRVYSRVVGLGVKKRRKKEIKKVMCEEIKGEAKL